MQLNMQIVSKKDTSHQQKAALKSTSAAESFVSKPVVGHRPARWRGRVQSVYEWGDHLVYGLSEFYGAVVMRIAQRLPGQHHHGRRTFISLLEGVYGGQKPSVTEDDGGPPLMADGGEGLPIGAFAALVVVVLCIGLLRWILQGRFLAASQKDGTKSGGLTELRWWHIFVLVQLDCMTSVTQDSYIPSMPLMAQQLHASESAVGLSLQINWIFSGFIALILGFASDKYGRRPALLTALTCYVVGALLCALSPFVECLIVARCIQGIGGGSQVLCYAIVRDAVQNGEERSKLFSLFSIAATFCIAAAPVAGGLAAVVVGWRMVFVILAVWGLLVFWIVLATLPETCPAILDGPEPIGGSPSDAPKSEVNPFRPILDVFKESLKPLGLMLSMWMVMPILMSILSSMPFVLDNAYGADTTTITWCTCSMAVCSLAGSVVCFVVLRWWTSWQLMRAGMYGLMLVGGALLALGLREFPLSMIGFVVLPCLYILCLSTITGPMRSLVAQPFGAAAGTANGLVMSLGGPLGAFFGFTITLVLQEWGVFAWTIMLGLLASFHQTVFWGFVGPAAEEDRIFEVTEGYLQYLKSKGKGKGK